MTVSRLDQIRHQAARGVGPTQDDAMYLLEVVARLEQRIFEAEAAGDTIPDVEFAWEADAEVRRTMSPRGPRYQIDGHISTPEALAEFPKGRRVYRTKAGPWIPTEE